VPPQILIIEDDARLAGMVAEYLGEAGLAVTIAADGADGLANLACEGYDAVILD
jgi:two-component system, OmpR family, phosphate regulon response regulator OmpR